MNCSPIDVKVLQHYYELLTCNGRTDISHFLESAVIESRVSKKPYHLYFQDHLVQLIGRVNRKYINTGWLKPFFYHLNTNFNHKGTRFRHYSIGRKRTPRTSFLPIQNAVQPFGAGIIFFLILAHPVYKMWIIQEPNTLELWNKLHFEEEKTESIYHV